MRGDEQKPRQSVEEPGTEPHGHPGPEHPKPAFVPLPSLPDAKKNASLHLTLRERAKFSGEDSRREQLFDRPAQQSVAGENNKHTASEDQLWSWST